MDDLLETAATYAQDYLRGIPRRSVAPSTCAIDRLSALGGALPDDASCPSDETSRRARGIEIWSALRSLGRAGLADLIERTCHYATQFADGLRAAGYTVRNDVVLNQVLVSFGDAATTQRVIAALQADGTCWCGGRNWQEHEVMRISVSSWATTEEDVACSLAAMLRIAAQECRV